MRKIIIWIGGASFAALTTWMTLQVFTESYSQIVIVNKGTENIRLDKIKFGMFEVKTNPELVLEPYAPERKINRYRTMFFRNQVWFRQTVSVLYTALTTGNRHNIDVIAVRSVWKRCRFVISLRDESADISDCLRSELDDFD